MWTSGGHLYLARPKLSSWLPALAANLLFLQFSLSKYINTPSFQTLWFLSLKLHIWSASSSICFPSDKSWTHAYRLHSGLSHQHLSHGLTPQPLPGLPASVLRSPQSILGTAAGDILLKQTGQLSRRSADPSMASYFIQSGRPDTALNSLLPSLPCSLSPLQLPCPLHCASHAVPQGLCTCSFFCREYFFCRSLHIYHLTSFETSIKCHLFNEVFLCRPIWAITPSLNLAPCTAFLFNFCLSVHHHLTQLVYSMSPPL